MFSREKAESRTEGCGKFFTKKGFLIVLAICLVCFFTMYFAQVRVKGSSDYVAKYFGPLMLGLTLFLSFDAFAAFLAAGFLFFGLISLIYRMSGKDGLDIDGDEVSYGAITCEIILIVVLTFFTNLVLMTLDANIFTTNKFHGIKMTALIGMPIAFFLFITILLVSDLFAEGGPSFKASKNDYGNSYKPEVKHSYESPEVNISFSKNAVQRETSPFKEPQSSGDTSGYPASGNMNSSHSSSYYDKETLEAKKQELEQNPYPKQKSYETHVHQSILPNSKLRSFQLDELLEYYAKLVDQKEITKDWTEPYCVEMRVTIKERKEIVKAKTEQKYRMWHQEQEDTPISEFLEEGSTIDVQSSSKSKKGDR